MVTVFSPSLRSYLNCSFSVLCDELMSAEYFSTCLVRFGSSFTDVWMPCARELTQVSFAVPIVDSAETTDEILPYSHYLHVCKAAQISSFDCVVLCCNGDVSAKKACLILKWFTQMSPASTAVILDSFAPLAAAMYGVFTPAVVVDLDVSATRFTAVSSGMVANDDYFCRGFQGAGQHAEVTNDDDIRNLLAAVIAEETSASSGYLDYPEIGSHQLHFAACFSEVCSLMVHHLQRNSLLSLCLSRVLLVGEGAKTRWVREVVTVVCGSLVPEADMIW